MRKDSRARMSEPTGALASLANGSMPFFNASDKMS